MDLFQWGKTFDRAGQSRLLPCDASKGRRRRELGLCRGQGRQRVGHGHPHGRLPQLIEERIVIEDEPDQDTLQPVSAQVCDAGSDSLPAPSQLSPGQIGRPPHCIDQPRIICYIHAYSSSGFGNGVGQSG
ncbi:hypothetical protein ACFVH0_36685 [Streptomyces sp. NPDC127117]|uniref:hypothetical protein n=1 Tax=Streptomyces sp. NPDC127117 TaxID=3345368 RepID=UPI003640630F